MAKKYIPVHTGEECVAACAAGLLYWKGDWDNARWVLYDGGYTTWGGVTAEKWESQFFDVTNAVLVDDDEE